jgi:hypothetical protein
MQPILMPLVRAIRTSALLLAVFAMPAGLAQAKGGHRGGHHGGGHHGGGHGAGHHGGGRHASAARSHHGGGQHHGGMHHGWSGRHAGAQASAGAPPHFQHAAARRFAGTNAGVAGTANGSYSYRPHRWTGVGGSGLGPYGAGYGNRGYGYGAYGNGYRYGNRNGYGGYGYGLSRYVRVYMPGLGWVLVPRAALRRALF